MKSVAVFAQENHKNSAGRLFVDSIPRGAYVEVSGNYTFVGRTPFVIPQKLYGKYKVTGRMDGYETISSTVMLARRGASQITLRLNKKTRLKAGYRSLLLPGWGQFYGQGKFKGALSGLTQLTLVAVTLVAESHYQSAKKEYELALDHFNSVRHNLDEAELAFTIVQRKFDNARDVQGFRNALIYVTAGFWVYTFLDSMIFFSKGKKTTHKSIWQKPYISGQFSHNKVQLSMSVSF